MFSYNKTRKELLYNFKTVYFVFCIFPNERNYRHYYCYTFTFHFIQAYLHVAYIVMYKTTR